VTVPRLPMTSLRARMTVGFMLWFAAFAVLSGISFLLWSWRSARLDREERVAAAARLVAQEWDGKPASQSVGKAFREAQEDMRLDHVSLLIVDNKGAILGANRTPSLPWPDPERAGWLTNERSVGTSTVIAGMDWNEVERALGRQALLLLGFTLLATTVVGIGTWRMVGRTLQPIGALSNQARSASADLLQARLSPPSEDREVRGLVDTLNGFLERFQENARDREQFYSAAAHELRTPLAVLSSTIEIALTRRRPLEEYEETLVDLQQETKRLILLSEGLLFLNRLQMQTEREEAVPVNIAEECCLVLKMLEPSIRAKLLQVETDWADDIEVLAPISHVAMLLRNLIENAVKYAPAGGLVRVALQQREGEIVLVVANRYPHPEHLPLERLDEPFFRADASRSTETGGNGLGLAICRRLVEANGWKLTLTAEKEMIVATVGFYDAAMGPLHYFLMEHGVINDI
jgi:signal transduction histidine kinase